MSTKFSVVTESTEEKRAMNDASHAAQHSRPPAHTEDLERENIRLQLLVAELLIKNQQLRKTD